MRYDDKALNACAQIRTCVLRELQQGEAFAGPLPRGGEPCGTAGRSLSGRPLPKSSFFRPARPSSGARRAGRRRRRDCQCPHCSARGGEEEGGTAGDGGPAGAEGGGGDSGGMGREAGAEFGGGLGTGDPTSGE